MPSPVLHLVLTLRRGVVCSPLSGEVAVWQAALWEEAAHIRSIVFLLPFTTGAFLFCPRARNVLSCPHAPDTHMSKRDDDLEARRFFIPDGKPRCPIDGEMLQSTGFYSPAWADIGSLWYATTKGEYAPERNALVRVWQPEFDVILRQAIEEHGTFVLAWLDDVAKTIKRRHHVNISQICRYYEYFLLTRLYAQADTRKMWLDSFLKHREQTYICGFCGKEQLCVEIHPSHLRRFGVRPCVCRACHQAMRNHPGLNAGALKRLQELMVHVSEPRECVCCGSSFSLEKDAFTTGPYYPCRYSLYFVNLYANVCGDCYHRAYMDNSPQGDEPRDIHLTSLQEFSRVFHREPQLDVEKDIAGLEDLSAMGTLFALYRHFRSVEGYEREFGTLDNAFERAGCPAATGERPEPSDAD